MLGATHIPGVLEACYGGGGGSVEKGIAEARGGGQGGGAGGGRGR